MKAEKDQKKAYNRDRLVKANAVLIQTNPCQKLDDVDGLDDFTVKAKDNLGIACLRDEQKKFKYLGLIDTQSEKFLVVDEQFWGKINKK